MSEPGGDYLADLSTAPIFHDAIYLSEALGLPEGQDEDSVDAHLAMSARESGIEDPYRLLCPDLHDISTSLSTMTVASDLRSSMSIHSRETQSTGITSHPSRTSKDNGYMESTLILRTLPPPSPMRGSTSFECYDTVLDRFRPSARHRPSSSTYSASRANSALSSAPSALPKPIPRKHKRASSLFSMFRKDSGACPSRSHQGHYVNPLSPKLDCGHSLSKYAIRVHIQEALESTEHIAPSCCGTLLPRSMLETVLSKEEADVVMAVPVELPPFSSQRDSGYGEDGISSVDLPHVLDIRSHPIGSFITAPDTSSRDIGHEDEQNLNLALANEAFISLRAQQKEQFERVSSFEANQRKALSAYHQWTLKRLSTKLEKSQAEKTKQHALELERLDESQIVAEHDLRKSHAQETQNVATALKYMEAYCSGASLTNSDIAHTITEDDRKKLARQHVIQEKLPGKHESAINVLRARQEKDGKTKVQKQQAELQQLGTDYESGKREEELRFMKDTSRLDALIEARRGRLIHRWDLKFEMWRRDWESQHSTSLNGRLPHGEWPESTHVEGPLDTSSSLALYSQIMV
ncbi:hypothetical protein K505DRAFT_273099 [Melanomma pulvis-pyrius CBS 109.77]|uniref:Uncharacterized protein n=1 Tax=Melanomma pulvis-pyrius CBS 109.77 TaxID=1314802 RepID=A0A6A6XGE7_9PLEO|nr:hypothetical protein K505DRAFT_273099 [Melanomma pulvis-pyrius CBS 109.77]